MKQLLAFALALVLTPVVTVLWIVTPVVGELVSWVIETLVVEDE